MTKEFIIQTLGAKLGMQVCILPQEEAVMAMLVVGWLVVTDSGGVVPGTICGDETTAERGEGGGRKTMRHGVFCTI